METKLKKRIDRGVIWLNKRFGKSWLRKVRPSQLIMRNDTACICGQLFKTWWAVVRGSDNLMSLKESRERGFSLSDNSQKWYELLTQLWVERIKKERKKLR